jgi:flagellar biosynthesis protein FliR
MIGAILALRGGAAIAVLAALVGGVPRIVQLGLAAGVGLWSAATIVPGAPIAARELSEPWLLAARELALGGAIGVTAALPLVAAATAGRWIDRLGGGATDRADRGPYRALFSVLAAAVFVAIDGPVAAVAAIATSVRDLPVVAAAAPSVLAVLARLVPSAAQLAAPWLVTAAVVEIAAGVALRLAGRAARQTPLAAAAPAALVMMTASLIGTLAVALAALVRAGYTGTL